MISTEQTRKSNLEWMTLKTIMQKSKDTKTKKMEDIMLLGLETAHNDEVSQTSGGG